VTIITCVASLDKDRLFSPINCIPINLINPESNPITAWMAM